MEIGTSGFRGIIGVDFTKENVEKIAFALSKVIYKKGLGKVLLGYDYRFMAEDYALWLAKVLASQKIEVDLFDRATTSPMISFGGKKYKYDLSIIVTASHNPYYYLGIKIFDKDGRDLSLELESLIMKTLVKVKKVPKKEIEENLIKKVNYEKEYIKSLFDLLKYKINCKVAFDNMHGTAVNVVKKMQKEKKLKFDILNENRDVTFNFSSPLPFEENLGDLKKKVLEEKLDFGFATDGDGDRLGVIDDKGNYLCGNEIAPLLYYFAIKNKGKRGAFVKNYSFSTFIDCVAKVLEGKVFETKIGFKYIGEKLTRENGLFGAENSGIEVPQHAYTKDGVAVFVLLMEVVSFYKKPLSQIVEELKKEVNFKKFYKEVSFEVKNRKNIEKYLSKNEIPFENVKGIGKLDGTKYIFENGFLLVRFSGTEDKLRLVAEFKNKKEVEEKIQKAKLFLEKL